MIVVGVFLCFGAGMALLAGTTLIWQGTILDRTWALNPTAYQQLAAVRGVAGPLFLVLSTALAVAATGWFKRRFWGWGLAVIIIAIQMLGDLVNALMGHLVKGATGVVIAGALLLYLLQARVRAAFSRGPASPF